MIAIIHQITGTVLILSHILFLLRAWYLLKSRGTPKKIDRLMMAVSQISLPFTIISGIPGITRKSLIHVIIGLMPLVMMFVLSRRSFRRKNPLFLPLVNGLFIVAAFLTGVILCYY